MSWKSIEMQIALPRTQDAGKIQEQMEQRGKLVQESLAINQTTTEELKRTTVTNTIKGTM